MRFSYQIGMCEPDHYLPLARAAEHAPRRDWIFAPREGEDGHEMTGANEVSGPAANDEAAGARFVGNDVGLEAGAAGDGSDEHFFTLPQVGGVHQIPRDADDAFIVHLRPGDGGAVDFGFEETAKHGGQKS